MTEHQFVQADNSEQRLWIDDTFITNLDTGAWYDTSTSAVYVGGYWHISYGVLHNGTLEVHTYTRPAARHYWRDPQFIATEELARLRAQNSVIERVRKMDSAKRATITPAPDSTQQRITALLDKLGRDPLVYPHTTDKERANAVYYLLIAEAATAPHKKREALGHAEYHLSEIETEVGESAA